MLLYLSSYRLGNSADMLRDMAQSTSAVVVTNALDFSSDVARRTAGTTREIAELGRLGFLARELDLREYFGRPEVLAEHLANVGLIWAVGGNSFLLRRALKQSGLDAYMLARRGDDTLVFGGYSAGACVVTPTLRGIDLADEPRAMAIGYEQEVIWDGLGLVPYSIVPHYKSNHPESALMDRVVEYLIANELPFKTLRDGEVIITAA
jgi:dipeptidase E